MQQGLRSHRLHEPGQLEDATRASADLPNSSGSRRMSLIGTWHAARNNHGTASLSSPPSVRLPAQSTTTDTPACARHARCGGQVFQDAPRSHLRHLRATSPATGAHYGSRRLAFTHLASGISTPLATDNRFRGVCLKASPSPPMTTLRTRPAAGSIWRPASSVRGMPALGGFLQQPHPGSTRVTQTH